MEIFKEIDTETAKKQLGVLKPPYHKPTYEFVQNAVDNASILFKARINNVEEFKGILLFPWDDWGLSYRRERRNIENPNMLYSMQLEDVALNYHEFKEEIIQKDNQLRKELRAKRSWVDRYTHTEIIDASQEKILRKGKYTDKNWDVLLLEENSKYYLIDGHHRLIAFMDLINNRRLRFNDVKCIIGKLSGIENYIFSRNRWIQISNSMYEFRSIRFNILHREIWE